MKTLVLLALVVLAGCKERDAVETSNQQNGRFLLHSGEYTLLSGDASASLKGVFKIDSKTGKTWMLVVGHGPAYWAEISEGFVGKPGN